MSPSLSLHGGDLISECADRSGSVGPGWDVHIHHDKGGKLSRQVDTAVHFMMSLTFSGGSCRHN